MYEAVGSEREVYQPAPKSHLHVRHFERLFGPAYFAEVPLCVRNYIGREGEEEKKIIDQLRSPASQLPNFG